MIFTRPGLLLRIEAGAFLATAIWFYQSLHFGWLLFALLLLTPDLFMLGYLVSPSAGAALYNLVHSLFMPLALFPFAVIAHHPALIAGALIWISHIALDRLLGYGLKYPTQFKDTHLQHLG